MRPYLKLSSALLLSIMLNTACNSTTDKKTSETNKQDTTAITVAPVKPMLKDVQLNEKTVILEKKLYNSEKISTDAFRSLSLGIIDSTSGDENGFKYHIIDTLFSGPNVKVLVIGREYESENYAWVAVYDSNNKLIDFKTVYYDNAEGFMSVETGIKNNLLSITTYNEYAEKEKDKKVTAVFRIDENNKFIKAP